MIAYTLVSALIPAFGWIYSATCRLFNPHARTWAKPRPHRMFACGRHVRTHVSQHRRTPTGLKEAAA